MDTTILLGLFVLILYFAPTWTAMHNHKKNTGAIFVLNFFLGWTFLGWVVALVWATTKDNNYLEG